MPAQPDEPIVALVAYDGSEEAAAAIRAASRLLPGAHAVVVYASGEPVAAEHAAEQAAVVVAGRRGRGAVASTVLGSVASGLVHNAGVPTLIVRGGELTSNREGAGP